MPLHPRSRLWRGGPVDRASANASPPVSPARRTVSASAAAPSAPSSQCERYSRDRRLPLRRSATAMAMPPEGPSAFHESDNERIAAPPFRAEATASPCGARGAGGA
eukprot:scaffold47888_cov63-Phaeocystis_antarctica.AAC.1